MARSPHEATADYSIASVSKLTGISCHALRVWERRYGFPVPNRSASGHRRYGREQVEVLRVLAARARAGESIGDLIAAHRAGRLAAAAGTAHPPSADPQATDAQAGFLSALFACDVNAAEATFAQLARTMPIPGLLTRVIEPALVEAGERWFQRECDVYLEHFVSGFLRRKLAQLIDGAPHSTNGTARTIAVGTVQGDRHEGGLLLVDLTLRLHGWQVVNLGVDLPASEFAKAVRQLRPDALGLSFVLSRNINKRFQELSRLGDLPVFVGGRSILNYQGLARRHGLIPVPGPVAHAAEQLRQEFDAWEARHGRAGTAGI